MRIKNILEDFLGQKSKVAILRILYQQPELTGREIARKTGLSPRAAQQTLQELHAKGVIHRKAVGASYLFSLNKQRYVVKHMLCPLFESEQGLLNAMISELLKVVPRKDIKSLIIFGSVVRGESERGSDLDVMILVEDSVDAQKVADLVRGKGGPFIEKFGMLISPYVIRRGEFVSRFDKKDKLILNTVKEGRVVFGEHFEEVLALEPQKASR